MDTATAHEMLGNALNSVLLLGILITAIFSIFKAGRWFQSMVASTDHLSESLAEYRQAFDQHVSEEDKRFTNVEITLDKHGKKIEVMHGELKKIAHNTNGARA